MEKDHVLEMYGDLLDILKEDKDVICYLLTTFFLNNHEDYVLYEMIKNCNEEALVCIIKSSYIEIQFRGLAIFKLENQNILEATAKNKELPFILRKEALEKVKSNVALEEIFADETESEAIKIFIASKLNGKEDYLRNVIANPNNTVDLADAKDVLNGISLSYYNVKPTLEERAEKLGIKTKI